jgi:quinol monooxygenase YgiN
MTTITILDPVVTLVNTFTVKPERQAELVRLLDQATEQVIRHLDGFVSANIHTSLDGQHVANYAQWRDEAAFRAMMADERTREHRERAAALAERFEPILYKVSSIHEAAR